MHLRTRLGVICLTAVTIASPLRAQISPADSAAVLLSAARELIVQGHDESYEDLLQLIVSRFGETPAGLEAGQLLLDLRGTRNIQSGRTALTAWSTIYGAWLGLALPAAFGAEEPAPYGIGLLLGAPLGFLGSGAYARSTSMSSGQAGTIIFGSWWGTWQGAGWAEVLDIGREESCVPGFGCFTSDNPSTETVFASMVAFGLAGYGTGLVVSRATDISSVTSTMITHSALWGTWYGVAGAALTGAEGEGILAWMLVAGNVGLVAGAVAGPRVRWSAGQVRTISVAGLAGFVAGIGIDLIGEIENEAAVIAPTAGATLGLVVMAATTNPARPRTTGSGASGGALLNLGSSTYLGMPLPMPRTQQLLDSDGRVRTVPAAALTLVRVTF